MNVSPVPVTIVTVSECCHAQIISTLYRIYLWNSYLFPILQNYIICLRMMRQKVTQRAV